MPLPATYCVNKHHMCIMPIIVVNNLSMNSIGGIIISHSENSDAIKFGFDKLAIPTTCTVLTDEHKAYKMFATSRIQNQSLGDSSNEFKKVCRQIICEVENESKAHIIMDQYQNMEMLQPEMFRCIISS